MSELLHVKTENVRANPVALRNVNKEHEKFVALRASIADIGMLNPISVRKKQDPDGTTFYELVDGLHRFVGASDAHLKEIPCQVISASDAEVLEAQIQANFHVVDTKPSDYSAAILRMLAANPTLTEAGLAQKLHVSPAFIEGRLSLNKLAPAIMELVDSGKIALGNAVAMSKLPEDEQIKWVEAAQKEQFADFAPQVKARAKEINKDLRAGRDPKEASFTPVPRLRTLKVLKEEVENEFPEIRKVVEGIDDPLDAAKTIVLWTISLDPASQEAQKARWAADKAARETRAQERKAERARKRADEAAKLAAETEAQTQGE